MSFKYTIPQIKNNLKKINIFEPSKIVNKTSNAGSNAGSNNYFLTTIFIIIFIIIIFIIVNILYYVLYDCYEKKQLGEYLFDMSFDPCVSRYNPASFKERKLEDEKEVFHIANQDYTYEQAKCKCAAYGGRLATKDEIIEAYNKGAEWCSYGWSFGQNAFYPTQKCTWDELQMGDPKHRNDCGLPGINGGYFANPNLKFGVNCFGIKPKGRIVREKKPVCTKKEFCQMDLNKQASNKLDSDVILPFNSNQWSAFV